MSGVNKKTKIKLYAKALSEILAKKVSDKALSEILFKAPAFAKASAWQEKIIDNFIKLLESTGYESNAKEILNLTEDLFLEKIGKKKIIFETARKMTDEQKKMLEGFAKKGDITKEKINPDLIAGVKIIINNSKQFDASMKSKLQKIL